MYHNGLRYGRIAALVLFTHIVMLLAVLFRGHYETIQDLAPLTIAVLGLWSISSCCGSSISR